MTNRRSFLASLGAGCALAGKSFAQPQRDQLFWTVETTSGKVQGISNTGIREFKGIPYGAPTGGKNHYMPPAKARRLDRRPRMLRPWSDLSANAGQPK